MRRSLSYADAVKMLGGGDIALVQVLDRFSAVGLLAVPGINLVAACRELVRAGDELLTRFGERLRGMDRLTRTERLRAAHAVIVLTAYFDTLQEAFADLPAGYPVRISTVQQVSLAGGPADAGLRGIAGALLSVIPAQPASVQSHEVMLEFLGAFYTDLSGSVAAFVTGLAAWDGLGEAERIRFAGRVRESVPGLAVGKYEELFRRLAVECPEFGIWADLFEHQATRAELRRGLAGLEDLLASVACERVPGQRLAALARAYRGALAKPIVPSGEVPGGLRIPTLGEGYVDHRIRVAEVGASSEPGRDSWWGDVPTRDDACRFLAGYLTSPAAQEAPLILLGQPGSGKSILTRILAARLPATDFLPVRVELRQVPAEADLQDQIEFAVRMATGESVSWPRLVESGNGALPVVILDGFDELLQATGVAQTDFLLRVLAFQEREADQGRPLAVIVTSRTAVTDRARIPDGAVAVRLEPFSDDQVTAWLQIWHSANAGLLAGRGLRPLPPDIALRHKELAEQPLLLLMLALYDADDNALQSRSAELGRTELYGRLLREFARREIRKHTAGLPEAGLENAVETELLRLSVVAFAMFNRRTQWVAEADLDTDLSMLLGSRDRQPPGLRAQLTAAQLAVGRFFFIHESHATRDETRLQTYEFLHATFGEFLAARLVTQILTDMTTREAAAAGSPLGGTDDGLLHALLSFAALTARAPIVAFLDDLLARLDPRQRPVLTALLLRLHSRALYQRTESAYNRYEPLALPVTARHAAWSANLVILAVLSAGEITGSQLFPQGPDPAAAWRNQAMMWRSQLTSEEWYGLCEAIALERTWDGSRREIRLWRDDGTFDPSAPDIHWTYNVPPGHPSRRGIFAWQGHSPESLQRKTNFTAGKSDDFMSYGLQPLAAISPAAANIFVNLETGPASAAQVMATALLALHEGNGKTHPVYTDLASVTRALAHPSHAEHGYDGYDGYVKIAIAILESAIEHGAAPPELLESSLDAATLNRDDARPAEPLARIRKLPPAPGPENIPPPDWRSA
jgi:hypothetical protein